MIVIVMNSGKHLPGRRNLGGQSQRPNFVQPQIIAGAINSSRRRGEQKQPQQPMFKRPAHREFDLQPIFRDPWIRYTLSRLRYKQKLAEVRRGLYCAGGFCQGPWNVDLRTPPGQECSNGSLLRVRRGVPGILDFR